MTKKWYATLRHLKMYPHTKFGIPTSKNIGDMDRTRKRDGLTDGLTDGRTVRLLYASQSSFGGIKTKISFTSWLCDVPVDVNENSVFQYFAFYYSYHFFSGRKRPWLLNKFCLLRFSISFPMVSFLSSLMH